MAYPRYLREKALQLRTEKHLSLDEIAERLALPNTTVYYWIKGTPLGRPRRAGPGGPAHILGSRAMQAESTASSGARV